MTIEQKAEERYPTELRGKELPNTVEHERYVYVQKAKQAAYLAGAGPLYDFIENVIYKDGHYNEGSLIKWNEFKQSLK